MNPEDEEDEDGAAMDLDANRKGKCAVIKTSTRQVRDRLEYEGAKPESGSILELRDLRFVVFFTFFFL
jgi:hypothetical protein